MGASDSRGTKEVGCWVSIVTLRLISVYLVLLSYCGISWMCFQKISRDVRIMSDTIRFRNRCAYLLEQRFKIILSFFRSHAPSGPTIIAFVDR